MSLLRQVTFLSPILGVENVLVVCYSELFGSYREIVELEIGSQDGLGFIDIFQV